MAGIGAKTFVRNKIRENISPDTVFDLACKKYPQVKPGSIRRYIDDYKNELEAHGKSPISGNSGNDHNLDNGSGDNNIHGDRTLPDNAKDQSDSVNISELEFELQPAQGKPESRGITSMYRSADDVPEARVKIERLPWLITKTFHALKKVGPLKKRLAKWNDEAAIKAVADDAQTVIQNRLHISSKHADVIDLGLSSGNLFLSVFLHVIDPDYKIDEKEQEKNRKIVNDLNDKDTNLAPQIIETAVQLGTMSNEKNISS